MNKYTERTLGASQLGVAQNSDNTLTLFCSCDINSSEASGRALNLKYQEFSMSHFSERHYSRYTSFIQSRQKRTISDGAYCEKHHILPRSLGGSDEPDNIIELTAREHYIAHLMLWKTYGGTMSAAFWIMNHTKGRRLSGRMYQTLKEENARIVSEKQKGVPRWSDDQKKSISERQREYYRTHIVSKETRKRISDAGMGRTVSDETRQKIAMTKVGKPRPEEVRRKISESITGHKYPPRSEEHRRKIGDAHRGKIVSSETRKKLSNYIQGRKWMHKDDEITSTRQVAPEDIDDMLNRGWKLGRGKRTW